MCYVMMFTFSSTCHSELTIVCSENSRSLYFFTSSTIISDYTMLFPRLCCTGIYDTIVTYVLSCVIHVCERRWMCTSVLVWIDNSDNAKKCQEVWCF